MGLLKNILGLGVAAGAAYAAYKVTKRYQENKEIDMIVNDDMPAEKTASEVVGDIARAATEVFFETKDKAVCVYNDVKEKIVASKCCDCCEDEECCDDDCCDCECCCGEEEEEECECCCECEEAEKAEAEAEACEAECCCCCEAPAEEAKEEE